MNIKHVGIVIIVAAVVVIAALVAYYAVEGKWPTPWNGNDDINGTWNEEIIITYSDGTTDSLKLLLINRDRPWPLAVQYEGKEIVGIDYIVYATATGNAAQHTTCNVDTLSFIIDVTVSDANAVAVYEETVVQGTDEFHNFYLDVNGGDELIAGADVFFYPYYIGGALRNEPVGEYTVSFTPGGSITYRGEQNGVASSDWYTATLPPGRSLVVDNVAGTITLNLILTSDIETI